MPQNNILPSPKVNNSPQFRTIPYNFLFVENYSKKKRILAFRTTHLKKIAFSSEFLNIFLTSQNNMMNISQMFAPFVSPPNKLTPHSLFALNRIPIFDRLTAGILPSDIFRELSDVLKNASYPIPHITSFYAFIRRGKKNKAVRKVTTSNPEPAQKTLPPPTSHFDSSKQFSDTDLI